ncbi:hypothetical protein Tco_1524640 [Tanacetum coccineum]
MIVADCVLGWRIYKIQKDIPSSRKTYGGAQPEQSDEEESKGEEEKMVPDKADNMMQVQRNTLSSTTSVILAFHVEHSSNVATPIQRASNVQSVIRRFLDEGAKESGFVNIEAMAASEPPSSSCRRSVQQNQPVTQPYPASDSRDVTHRLLTNSANTVIVCLHYMLRMESVSRANNANVLWCYKNKLELSRSVKNIGATSDVEKNSSDCGKRKLTTYKDSDIFETYSQLFARNVRPRFSSDLPQASGVNTSQPMYNEVILTTLVLQFQTNVKEHARTLKEDHQHMKQRAQKEYAAFASTTTNLVVVGKDIEAIENVIEDEPYFFTKVVENDLSALKMIAKHLMSGGEVKRGGVDLGVVNSLLGEFPGDVMGESGGETFGVDG